MKACTLWPPWSQLASARFPAVEVLSGCCCHRRCSRHPPVSLSPRWWLSNLSDIWALTWLVTGSFPHCCSSPVPSHALLISLLCNWVRQYVWWDDVCFGQATFCITPHGLAGQDQWAVLTCRKKKKHSIWRQISSRTLCTLLWAAAGLAVLMNCSTPDWPHGPEWSDNAWRAIISHVSCLQRPKCVSNVQYSPSLEASGCWLWCVRLLIRLYRRWI